MDNPLQHIDDGFILGPGVLSIDRIGSRVTVDGRDIAAVVIEQFDRVSFETCGGEQREAGYLRLDGRFLGS